MQILIAHNHYKQSGGEDESFSSETGFTRSPGSPGPAVYPP